MELLTVVLFAALLEAVVETVKMVYSKDESGKAQVNVALLIAIGIAVPSCILFAVDLFALTGFVTTVPYIGQVFTGFVVARGASFVHDLLKGIQEWSHTE